MENKDIWLTYSAKEKEELHKICELYKSWLEIVRLNGMRT